MTENKSTGSAALRVRQPAGSASGLDTEAKDSENSYLMKGIHL